MKHLLHIIALLLIVGPCHGQDKVGGFFTRHNDSLHYATEHAFHWREAIAPAALITTGSVITAVPTLFDNVDVRLRDAVQADGHESFKIEDYAQYAPLAGLAVLQLCGVKGKHNLRDMINLTAGSYLLGSITLNITKYSVWKERPNGSDWKTSFPSGHTFTAFTAAELLRREYGENHPIIPIVGYTVATGIGVMRVYNNKHWASDVLAGAGLGILSASVMYWLAPHLRF